MNSSPLVARGALLGNLVGLAVIVTGAITTAGLSTVDAELPYVTLALFGLMVAGLANGLYLLRARQNIATTTARVLADHRPGRSQANAPLVGSNDLLLAGAGMSYLHRAGCQMVVGKGAVATSAGDGMARGLGRCPVCRP